MSEYVELSQLQKFCREYTATDAVGLILADRTDLLHTIPAIPIPEYATYGDIIKSMFPDTEIDGSPYTPNMNIYVNGILMMQVDMNLWNAPYKKEGEQE